MACTCGSNRLMNVQGHCDDRFFAAMAGQSYDGYVPYNLGIGGGDDVHFKLCLDCGKIQGEWPLPLTKMEKLASAVKSSEFDHEFDRVNAIQDGDEVLDQLLILYHEGKVELVLAIVNKMADDQGQHRHTKTYLLRTIDLCERDGNI